MWMVGSWFSLTLATILSSRSLLPMGIAGSASVPIETSKAGGASIAVGVPSIRKPTGEVKNPNWKAGTGTATSMVKYSAEIPPWAMGILYEVLSPSISQEPFSEGSGIPSLYFQIRGIWPST